MTAQEYVAGLRELADWIEANETFVAEHVSLTNAGTLLDYCSDGEELAEHVRVLGRGEKGGDDKWFNVTRQFGPIAVQVYTSREKVCRKVERVKTVTVEEWECDPILAPKLEAVES